MLNKFRASMIIPNLILLGHILAFLVTSSIYNKISTAHEFHLAAFNTTISDIPDIL